jgi:cytoskeletal protein RodZ
MVSLTIAIILVVALIICVAVYLNRGAINKFLNTLSDISNGKLPGDPSGCSQDTSSKINTPTSKSSSDSATTPAAPATAPAAPAAPATAPEKTPPPVKVKPSVANIPKK